MKNLSVARTILAILWMHKGGTIKFFQRHPYYGIFCRNKNKKTCLSSLSRLKKSGFISPKGRSFLLAPEGKGDALAAFISAETELYREKIKKWDGKWRMVFFDIPEHKRRHRDYLRKALKLIGFKEFQRSIWIYPYHAPVFLKDLLFGEDISGHVRFVTTEHIDNDQDLKNIFGLV
ncbi:MAG: hypothetical protein A3B99_00690 [Candidatus Yanofskybacteria bacterium RIFCSPHIGHO2_02_FULL_44_12b]|uniref:Transcriptional repressor PaaX-like central Cas2-like domain-containing protein n=2 Tax=Candidatus Yanofskyibacteriota TaxID=1752733 RepID=A0A1F8GJD0_9BACT|nr:MAG: repressor [Candidatus Yanofskybacteria bacterium GW2011_GWA2_44_9]OGN05354.1 MAG: hypothetical protein A2659_02010 [Candidatus Yanofskybacteria bacterium RIFCSPHIGHO2_01_FULL_44_24]OGN15996.1 MAG: hypothetical protein A3B99_00690 [Candidatus Yanofskybacteria bacterium RIFCSPHIGHO2_02_FULL_44_12b]OGN25507.1 MAG: hypothetical protein A2925_02135 [Candidatus Yanofskybacteria bacterium RIFCSPLOWO2_01_FULL_44_22]